MRRRNLLAVLGASLGASAGCLSAVNPGADPTTTAPSFDATTVQRRVSLDGVDDVPDYPLAIDAELLNGAVTGENSAHVQVTITNEAGETRRYTNNEGQCAIFNRDGGKSEPAGLHLHQSAFPGYAMECADPERRGNRWQLDRPASEPCVRESYGCAPVAYEPGEARATTFQVWDDYTVSGYFSSGTYRFEREVTVGSTDDGETFRWGFDLDVERPE